MSDKFELKLKNKQEPLRLKLASGGFVAIPRDAIRTVTSLPENAVPGQVVALVSEDDEFSDGFYISQATEDETVKWELYLTSIDIVEWDDIKNKPFDDIKYYDDVICDEEATDKVTTEYFKAFEQDMFYVKVGELPTVASEYISKINALSINTGLTEPIAVENKINVDNGAIVKIAPITYIVAVDVYNTIINVDVSYTNITGVTFPESGLYFLHAIQADGTQMGVQKATFEKTIPLDEKYMPESYGELQKDVLQLNEKSKRYDQFESKIETNETKIASAEEHNIIVSEQLNSHANNFSMHLPTVYLADKGKFARVNENGKWAAETIPSFEESEF